MSFERNLFEKSREALPHMTARTFSAYCGMSEGYYGSITAQRIPIATNALIYLAEMLEHRKGIVGDRSPETTRKLADLQRMIADEIARRSHSIHCDNHVVRKMIIGSLAKVAIARDQRAYLPPLIIG